MPLELAFATKELRDLCETESKAHRALGSKAAIKLHRRLADLRAATSVRDLVAGCPKELNNELQVVMQICRGYRVIFCANHNKVPLLKCGSVNWSEVTRVKILEIQNDHD